MSLDLTLSRAQVLCNTLLQIRRFVALILFLLFGLLISFLFLLLRVAFYTLFERKLLSYTQGRVGPNKVRVGGLLQPLLDGIKLLSKEFLYPQFSSIVLFLFSPILFFIFRILL